MDDHNKDVASVMIRHILGEERFQEICQKFDLTSDDKRLLGRLLNEWKPEWSVDDMVSICQSYENYPNVERVMQAWEAIAVEASRVSTSRRLKKQTD